MCGHQVRGQQADLAPDQDDATAHRLGPRVMAVAQVLHDGVGIPVRKVPAVMAALTGVRLTQGALTQDALRRTAGPVGTVYEQLRDTVPEAPVVHTDDTGWRVGGKPAHLMAFETEAATVYQVRPRQRHEEVPDVMPPNDAGVMVTHRGRSDDAQAFDRVDQHKCLAHILRSISEVVETKSGRACDFGEPLKALLQEPRRPEPAPRPRPEGKELRATLEGTAVARRRLPQRVAQREGPQIATDKGYDVKTPRQRLRQRGIRSQI